MLTFETIVPSTLPEDLNNNPNTGFMTEFNGTDHLGILQRAVMALNDQTSQAFKLLAGPNFDENALIGLYWACWKLKLLHILIQTNCHE